VGQPSSGYLDIDSFAQESEVDVPFLRKRRRLPCDQLALLRSAKEVEAHKVEVAVKWLADCIPT
jgi:hypothetical protein